MTDRLTPAELLEIDARAERASGEADYRFVLESCRDVDRLAREVRALQAEAAELRRQLTCQRDNNHERNVELDAMHYVWCDGGCKGGTHRFTPGEISEEIVAAAERNTERLRTWWENAKGRAARAPKGADHG